MSKSFSIYVSGNPPEMLQNPPKQYAHLGVLFTPFCVSVGGYAFPHGIWTDFSGVLLLRWHQEIRRLIAHESRYARLIFCDTPGEVWLRRTRGPWWKVSCVTWTGERKVKTVEAEALCRPEHVEAELHAASHTLLDAARNAGVWTDDASALEAFLNGEVIASGSSS